MEPFNRLQSFEQIKVLSDPRRLSILKHLMAGPATLSQLGRALNEQPAWIRHHLKLLEGAGLVELVETKVSDGYIEKFYQSKAHVYHLQELLLPECGGKKMVVLSGSHDLALELLASSSYAELNVFTLPVGSLNGLVALRQGMCNATGCHLYDSASGDFNTSFVRHFFPDKHMALITLAYREQGLILPSGNPDHVTGLEDLARGLRFINRNRGSGTRLWLDGQLNSLGISPNQILGYANEVSTHTEVARTIHQGLARIGLGIQAAAAAYQLDFIPLFTERYDIVMENEQLSDNQLAPLFDKFYSAEFRQGVASLDGYDTSHLGDRILI